MIQILITKNKYYKRKYLFIIQLCLSIIILFTIIYFIFNYFHKIKIQEDFSKQLTTNYSLSQLYNNYKTDQQDDNNYYQLFGTIEIPKISLKYSIFSTLDEEKLKIAPCKFFGKDLNSNDNICIAAHNYDNGKFFSDIILLDINDVIYLFSDNIKYSYNVISKYEVNPNNLDPIFEYDNNKYLTLVTCNNLNGNRVIIKAVQN